MKTSFRSVDELVASPFLPASNTKPKGVEHSFHAQRKREELPLTYGPSVSSKTTMPHQQASRLKEPEDCDSIARQGILVVESGNDMIGLPAAFNWL